MKQRDKALLFSAITLSAVLVAVALLWRVDTRKAPAQAPAPAPAPAQEQAAPSAETPAPGGAPVPVPEENQREVTLFFQVPGGDDLQAEKRKIFLTASVSDQARQTVKELITGPEDGLAPTFPPTAEVREVYLARDGTAYVDFSQSLVDDHPGGSSAEIDTIFSLVDTLTFNFPEIKRVKILVEGEERPTLKDHLDLLRPYVADMSIVTQGGNR